MTATDINVGEEAARRLAGQVFDAPKDYTKAKETASGNADGNGNGKALKSKQKQKDEYKERKRPYTTYKYSVKGNDILHEAILLAGQPVFVTYDDYSGEVKTVPHIEEATRVLVPPSAEEYPYEPYLFATIDLLNKFKKIYCKKRLCCLCKFVIKISCKK